MTLLESRSGAMSQDVGRPVLQTKRLTLRAPRPEDAPALAQLADDRRIAENIAQIPHPYRLTDAESFIASAKAKGDANFIIALADATPIGVCGIAIGEGPSPELGYWLGLSYWGHGFATEAVRAVIDYAFADLKHESIQAGARVTNPASRRVLEKCGFQWTGVGLYRIQALASSAPIDRFRLERGIWASLKSWGPMRRVA
jgi:RimJ/RimL family protein N-acetyltransferase